MSFNLNGLGSSLRRFAETAIVLPLQKFIHNPALEGNIIGRTKIIGKTLAVSSVAQFFGGLFFGLPTVAMLAAGTYTFRSLNENYMTLNKAQDKAQLEGVKAKVSEFTKRIFS